MAEKTGNIEKYLNSAIIDSIDFAEIGLCICMPNGSIVYINQIALDILDRPKDKLNPSEMIDKNISQIALDFETVIDKVCSENHVRNLVLSLKTESGNTKWILYNADISIGDKGEKNIVIIFRDVSASKNLEIELQKSKREMCSIVGTIPDIVYRVDPGGIITFISDEVKQYGYTSGELIGKNILDIIHPEDRDKALRRVKERRTGKRRTRSFDVRILTKSGGVIPFEVEDREFSDYKMFSLSTEGIYMPDENEGKVFIGTQGIARDINKRKNIEYALSKSEEKWQTIMESLEDGYYEVDIEGCFRYMNKAFCLMIEYDYDEIIDIKYDNFIDKDDVEDIYHTFNEVYKTGAPTKLNNWVMLTKSSRKKYFEGSISLIKDINEKKIGFRGIVRDITEKKKMEKELLRARKLEAIGIIAGGIAHDYNNALTAILGNISIAKMKIDSDNNELMEVLEDAEAASIKVMELTKRLSMFAKGGKSIREITNIADLLYEAVNVVLEKYSGNYELSIPDNLWEVEIDEFQISQVISYILKNAIESMPDGGNIYISVENVKVEKEESHHEITLKPDNYVKILIRHESKGINVEDVYNIFDPDFAIRDLDSGMGLATSYAIVKRHYGYIDVKSIEGEGTTFFVYLPVAK